MAVQCSKCGEELLGAVNRCWRCGQVFAAPAETEPGRNIGTQGSGVVLDAIVVEGRGAEGVASAGQRTAPLAQRAILRMTTGEVIDARRAGLMAMGGTVTSLVLGVFSSILAIFWPPAAVVAVLGLAMGLWGLSSPRRNLALLGMLLCCLAIGIGAYGLARNISIAMQKNRPVQFEDVPANGN